MEIKAFLSQRITAITDLKHALCSRAFKNNFPYLNSRSSHQLQEGFNHISQGAFQCYHTNQYATKRFGMSQYNTRMSYYIRFHFVVCKPACFSGYSDPQSSVRRNLKIKLRYITQFSRLTDASGELCKWCFVAPVSNHIFLLKISCHKLQCMYEQEDQSQGTML